MTSILAGCTGRATLPANGRSDDDDGGRWDRSGLDRPIPDRLWPTAGWVTIQPDTFLMGSPESEFCRLENERLHHVTLSRPYEIGATEVTQAAFLHAVGHNPSTFLACGPDCPVDSVDWSSAVVYCNRLSEQAHLDKCYSCVGDGAQYAFPYDCTVRSEFDGTKGKQIYDCPGYRLPTEAEWERAYRAGGSSPLFNGPIASCFTDPLAGAIGWYVGNSGKQAHPVGTRIPNAWGLYDMAGNLWEWVNDWYRPDLGGDLVQDPVGPSIAQGKVLRGGAWIGSPGSLRGASRNQNMRHKTLSFVGFRCARTLPN